MSGHTPPQGYRTPIDEDDSDDDDADRQVDDDPPPLTPRAASLLHAPSPNSAILTVSLDGYLEPTRISFGSPPSSELNPRGPSPDETFPVFSPPPYDQPQPSDRPSISNRGHRRQSSYLSGAWLSDLHTPRASIISTASRSPNSHHTCNPNWRIFIKFSWRKNRLLRSHVHMLSRHNIIQHKISKNRSRCHMGTCFTQWLMWESKPLHRSESDNEL